MYTLTVHRWRQIIEHSPSTTHVKGLFEEMFPPLDSIVSTEIVI